MQLGGKPEEPESRAAIEPASAIVLAGGGSGRMKQDKGLLPVDGMPLIEYVCQQLRPHFQEILVSAGNADRYAFLHVRVVPDRVAGQGPLMGIASTLEASSCDLNLVVACDIPTIDIAFARYMLERARGVDGVVPVDSAGRYEPLLAVYRKRMLPAMWQVLSAGRRRIRDVFGLCNINVVELGEAAWLRNLNTAEDYEQFLEQCVGIYRAVAGVLRERAYMTVIVKNVKKGGRIYPLAWDLGKALGEFMTLKDEKIWCQDNQRLAPYGMGSAWVSNTMHHYCLNFRRE